MKKLKLELDDLEITTFEPAPAEPQARGTLYAHAKPQPLTFGCTLGCQPTDPNLDCTYGCSFVTACPNGCFPETFNIECP
jgi:hypothetical protein